MIHSLDLLEEIVVVEPHDEDRRETRQIGEIDRPLMAERTQKGSPAQISRVRHFDIQHEQRDRDRDHAVAERLKPPGLILRNHMLFFFSTQRNSLSGVSSNQ